MWTCPKCGSQVDPSFDVCWNCGTTPEGVEDPTFINADDAGAEESPVDLDMPAGEAPIPEPATPIEGELVECYWALDLMQAKFLADQLTDQGIPAMSDTIDLHDALGSMSSGPRVRVRAEDLPRARAWLEGYEAQNKADHGGDEE